MFFKALASPSTNQITWEEWSKPQVHPGEVYCVSHTIDEQTMNSAGNIVSDGYRF